MFKVTLNGTSGLVSFQVRPGSATSGSDYVEPSVSSLSATIADGGEHDFTLKTLRDNYDTEGNETVELHASLGTLSAYGRGRIRDGTGNSPPNQPPPVTNFAWRGAGSSVVEGDVLTFTLDYYEIKEHFGRTFRIVPYTATPGLDYVQPTDRALAAWRPVEQTFRLATIDDDVAESWKETLTAELSWRVGWSTRRAVIPLSGTIIDDDGMDHPPLAGRWTRTRHCEDGITMVKGHTYPSRGDVSRRLPLWYPAYTTRWEQHRWGLRDVLSARELNRRTEWVCRTGPDGFLYDCRRQRPPPAVWGRTSPGRGTPKGLIIDNVRITSETRTSNYVSGSFRNPSASHDASIGGLIPSDVTAGVYTFRVRWNYSLRTATRISRRYGSAQICCLRSSTSRISGVSPPPGEDGCTVGTPPRMTNRGRGNARSNIRSGVITT